jgi:thiosulfate reductase cytochrome b subunit
MQKGMLIRAFSFGKILCLSKTSTILNLWWTWAFWIVSSNVLSYGLYNLRLQHIENETNSHFETKVHNKIEVYAKFEKMKSNYMN